MAQSDIIKNQDLFEKNFLVEPKNNVEDLNLALLDLAEGFKLVHKESVAFLKANQTPKTAEELKKINAELDKSVKARKGLSEVEKQLQVIQKQNETLQKKILSLEQAKDKAKKESTKSTKNQTDAEKVQSQLEAKSNRDRIKQLQAESILLDAKAGKEAKINAQLTILRLNRAKLTGEESDYLKQVNKINKAIDKENALLNTLSDKQKKAKQNVGNYTESVRDAIDSSETFKNILGGVNNQSSVFITATKGVVNQLKKIREGFAQAETRGAKFKAVLKGGALAGVAVIGAGITAIASTYRSVSNEIELKTAQIGNVLIAVFSAFANLIQNKLSLQIENLFLKFERFTTSKILSPNLWQELTNAIEENEKSISNYSETFSDLGNVISKGNDFITEQIKLQQQLIDTTNIYQRDISKLNAQIEEQNEIAGDGTRTFGELNKANKEALRLTEQKIGKEVKLAKISKDAVVLEVQRAFLNAKQQLVVSKNDIESLKFIKDKNTENIIGIELQQKLTDALVQYNEKRGALLVAEIKSEKEKRQILQDEVEKNLDIIIDGYDNQKTINERIIADEKRQFSERRKLLEETKVLGEKAFLDEEAQLQRLTKERINAEELVKTANSSNLNERIRALKVSETGEQRALEVIKERRTQIQDLSDAQKDLAQAEKESQQRILDSQKAIADSRRNLEIDLLDRQLQYEQKIQDSRTLINVEQLKKLETQKDDLLQKQAIIDMEREKEIAKQTIFQHEELDAKLLEIEEKQKEKLYQLERDKQQKIKELNKQQFDNYVNEGNKAIQNLLNSYDDFANKRSERDQLATQKDIDKRQTSIQKQSELAQKGLANNLAFEEQQLAKAELKKKQLEEKQAREQRARELVKSYFNFLNARLTKPDADPNTAPFKAVTDVVLSEGIAKGFAGLSGFYEGTEHVANDLQGNKFSDGRDGYAIRVDGSERILTGNQNAKIGNINNDTLASVAQDFRNGNLIPISQLNEASRNIQKGTAENIYNSILIQQNSKILNTLEEIKNKPVQMVNVNAFRNLVEDLYYDNRKESILYKNSKRRL